MGRGFCYECGAECGRECADCGIRFCRRHGTECDRCKEAVCSAHLAVWSDRDAWCKGCNAD